MTTLATLMIIGGLIFTRLAWEENHALGPDKLTPGSVDYQKRREALITGGVFGTIALIGVLIWGYHLLTPGPAASGRTGSPYASASYPDFSGVGPGQVETALRQYGTREASNQQIQSAIAQLRATGTQIDLQVSGEVSVRSLADYPEAVRRALRFSDVEPYSASDIREESVSTSLQATLDDRLEEVTGEADRVLAIVRFKLVNQESANRPTLLQMTEQRTTSSGGYLAPESAGAIMGLALTFELDLTTINGETKTVSGMVVPRHDRYQYKQIHNPYALLAELAGESLAERIMVEVADLVG